EETEAYCRAEGLEFRSDPTNRETKRGLIREEILPRLRELHPAALENLLRLAEERPSSLEQLLATTTGSKRLDLGGGGTAVLVRGDEVVAVPGIVEVEGIRAERVAG